MVRTALIAVVLMGLTACGSAPAAQPGFATGGNTNSPIRGETLRCTADYPDSRLVFASDGTLGGRYAGHDVSGSWTALSPDTVEVLVRAGAIAVRDTVRQTSSGWRGENTSCG